MTTSTLQHKETRWGSEDMLWCTDGWQLKRLVLNARAKIDTQIHKRKNETLIVVRGYVHVALNSGNKIAYGPGETVIIPACTVHVISEATGESESELLELASGDEDDVIYLT